MPVWRSPMISSRWPRPTGTIESIDFRAGLHRLRHRRRQMTPGATFSILSVSLALIGPFAVDRLTERVDDAADQLGADRHFENAAGGLDRRLR